MPTLKTYKNGQWIEVCGTPADSIDELILLAERVTTAEEKIVALETEMESKANDSELATIAKSGDVVDLSQTEGDQLIFNCGLSYK